MSNWRWWICSLLFVATTINYLDRQVLSLTYEEFIKPEFHWTDAHYGTITGLFSIFYAVACLFAGKFIDWMGTKKGYLIAIGVWSGGACLHAACGWATMHIEGLESLEAMRAADISADVALAVATTGVYLFLLCRGILALGEAGNFPAAIKVTAEYFPKKDRAFATSIFNAGASVGALAAPLCIPALAKHFGWEMAFIIIGALGFIWMFFWQFMYDKPKDSKRVNEAELAYIHQDDDTAAKAESKASEEKAPISMLPYSWVYIVLGIAALIGSLFIENTYLYIAVFALSLLLLNVPFFNYYKYRQTWSFFVGKFLTDGVWWFFLFWAPSYFQNQFGYKASSGMGMALIFVLYAIVTFLSIFGGYLPKLFVEKKGMEPYAGRMLSMLIFAFFPLCALLAQPLGAYSAWWPAILIGLAGAGHQAWSANLFSTVGDMFPKSTIATVTGIGAMAGGIGSMIIQKSAGTLFTFAEEAGKNFTFLGFEGKPAGYFIMFCFCGVAYIIGWSIMKGLVPKYKPVEVK
ncbi:MAG: MFS transporter [Paludibacteraceae bacterium]|nr:MFS transporter [Paludibacteraceae bacterium]MBQ2189918.1 MFS transporter [Paludibacteraceae bacterium]MBQ2520667.1 MFS transporter [Paludibacteraceae bacterium]MBQ4017840.1 MFS transporter [Paludibacteraceae bacterium]MBQ5379383.1 MFS transporter [Paludibacteraceae bacterium]